MAGSYAYNNTMVLMETILVDFARDQSVKKLQFSVTDWAPLQTIQKDDYGDFSMAGFRLKFSSLTLPQQLYHGFDFSSRIDLSREFGIYLWSYYIPSGLFVSVSWVSFLIPADAIPGRMSLLVTTVLVLVNIFG